MDEINHPDPIVDPGKRKVLAWMSNSVAFFAGLMFLRPDCSEAEFDRFSRLRIGLDSIIADQRAARTIGSLYLGAYPEENDLDRLSGELMEAAAEGDSRIVRRRIQELRVRDFTREDTVVLNGWVLARVEARVCALFTLF